MIVIKTREQAEREREHERRGNRPVWRVKGGWSGVPMPMIRRNALLMNPHPQDPKDFTGEEYRGKVRGFPGRWDEASENDMEQYVRGKKYGVDDWNLAEADAKKWLKENKQSKASLDHMREVFLKGILLERWGKSLESGPATGEGWPREEGTMGDRDTEWGTPDHLVKERLLSRMKKDKERALKRAEEEKKHKDIRKSIKRGK